MLAKFKLPNNSSKQLEAVAPLVRSRHTINTKFASNAKEAFDRDSRSSIDDGIWLIVDPNAGRLGNQIFQYASSYGIYTKLMRSQNETVHFCRYPGEIMDNLTRDMFVGPFANICPDDVMDYRSDALSVQVNKSKRFQTHEFPCEGKPCVYRLNSYFVSFKYFSHVGKEMKSMLSFQSHLQNNVDAYIDNLNLGEKTLVGIHFRRGDMVRHKNLLNEPPFSYFQKAIDLFRDRYGKKNVFFLVASDSPDYCVEQEIFQTKDVRVITEKHTADLDLAILASCEHFINSRGSYGWWAGWMVPGDVVYYENVWTPFFKMPKGEFNADYFPPNWIPIGD